MNAKRIGRLSLWLATSVVLMLAVPERAHTQVQDITPPNIIELTFSPASIDVSSGSQVVTVNALVFVDRAVGGIPFKPFGTWSKTF